ncbi:MAG: hypothetical protein GWN01_14425, partial [Nitrosopumilaceae archaeon]|nr:hypothetical protein [Nitrosopumilaceae archaeon]NIU88455.1 hypothetical protein [Nitrosopumilaceae archaeon]NIV66705.1 hypothetical protein [Nitrosopumilaceae archaeon]NIX62654.1 hypothetical protein [Nitrosopumilaceae archaeon]
MKFEHGIIPFFGFLILVILVLILSNPNEIPSITQLNQINEKALLAKEDSNNQDKIESYKSMMKEKLEPIAANSLGINNVKIFLENY